jgi:selenocysteine-specific elongation factor
VDSPRRIVVGTAGHIDHGKSLLVKTLTGTDPDRLKEEQERGITIDLGFASLALPGGLLVGFVDVPGHERFVRNMLAGVGGIDLVLMVIAADESIKPQTREHFDICRLLRIPAGIVVLTKSDLVEPEILDLVRLEVRDFLVGSFLERAPMISVSARTGEGLEELKGALAAAAAAVPERPAGRVFRLPVDRSFSIKGFGTVVTGTMISGRVAVGEEVEVLPSGLRARVRGLEVFGVSCREASAGQRTAVNLQGVETAAVVRGDLLAPPGTFTPSRLLDVRLEALAAESGIEDQASVRFHHLSAEGMGRVRLAGRERLAPGESAPAQIRLSRPVAALPGDRFILRRPSPAATLGGGVVLDNFPRKLRTSEIPAAQLRWERLENPNAAVRLREIIRSAGAAGLLLGSLRSRSGLEFPALMDALREVLSSGELLQLPGDPPRFIAGGVFQALQDEIVRALESFHRDNPLQVGLSKEEIRSRYFRREPGEIFRFFLEEAVRRKRLRVERDLVALHTHQVSLQGAEAGASRKLEETFRTAGLNPPEMDQVTAALGLPRRKTEEIFHLLVKQGVLVRIKEGMVFHRESLDALKRRLWKHREDSETIDIATFKDISGTTRKNAIPLLEHLDALRVTRRDGNLRRILPPPGGSAGEV